MGETYRGSATPLTEQRTDQMIVIISLGLVLALVVSGSIVAAHSYGDQKQGPTDGVQENIAIDHFDPTETAQPQALREPDFVMESEIHSHSHQAFSNQTVLAVKTRTFCKHLDHKQSAWGYSQTAVQEIFEPKKHTTEV